METIDFGCQVRCLNRQRLIPGSSHPQLNQCASQFLAKVRKEVTMCDSSSAAGTAAATTSKSPQVGWMKLKLSERGLRILPPVSSSSSSSVSISMSSCASSTTSSSSASASFGAMRSQQHRKSDEGFESDSDTSIRPHNAGSGGCSSGVNSSSSDMDESDEGRGGASQNKKTTLDAGREDSSDSDSAEQTTVLLPIRCPLSDILSCQHPAALGRHVVLLTLRSADDSALDILALECSAQEPARILTLLCQKIQASSSSAAHPSAATRAAPPSCAATAAAVPSTNDVTKTGGGKVSPASSAGGDGPAPKTAAVSIQSWSEREDGRTLDAILVDSKHSAPLAAGGGVKAHNIIRKLERQHSEWSLIQRRTRDGLTHLQVSKHKSTSTVAGGGDVAATAAAMRGHFNGSVPTATSGPVLNNSNNSNNSSKKGMPCGDQMARLEPALAITNSNQGHGSRIVSSGVDGVVAAVAGLKRSDTSVVMHQKLSKSKSSGSSASTCSSPPSSSSSSSCILSLQTPELPLCGPSVTALSPAVVTDASTSPSPPPPPLPQSLPPAKTSRWSFGAPFRQQQQQQQQQRLVSPEASRRNAKCNNQRGRSCERKSCKLDACSTLSAPQSGPSDLDGLFVSSSGMLSIKSNNNHNNNNNKKEKKKSKSSKSLPELLAVQSATAAPPKLKRDPSKTRSFLMKLTSSSRKSPTPPTSAGHPPPPPAPLSTLSLNSQRSGIGEREHRAGQQQQQQHPLKLQSRGRSLIRLRSSTRLQSTPPPTTTSSSHSGQTFLIPTKSGQELTRNIYPKEGPAAAAAASQLQQQQQQQQQQPLHQPVFHLLSGHNNKNASGLGIGRLRYNAGPPVTANGWAGYCWNDASGASLVRHSVPTYASPSSIDPNNNQHLQQQQQQQQQQWIYFHPHHGHHLAMHPAPLPQLQPPPTLMKAGDFNKLRLQRSRSQSPGRMRSSQRWLPAAAPAGPSSSIGHYYAVPTPMHHQQQPVSLPPDVGLVLSQQHRTAPACNSPSSSSGNHQELLSSSAARSFRRSKSTHTRMSTRSHLTQLSSSKSTNHNNNNNNHNNNKAVTFHAFATVQLVD